MIAFATLLLGLIVGVYPVELHVAEDTAAVKILLDGRAIATLREPPWSVKVDFGTELAPHELAAVVLDELGREVEGISQWVNLPRAPAQATLILNRDEKTVRSASLSWESLAGGEPTGIRVTFDDEAIQAKDPRHIALPSYDPDVIHFLRADLEFPGGVTAYAEAFFGGHWGDRVAAELTAVPVSLEDTANKSLNPSMLLGSLVAGSRLATPVAVEKGEAFVILVRDDSSRGALNRVRRGYRPAMAPALEQLVPLQADQRVRFLWPVARREQGAAQTFDLFPWSQPFSARESGLFWLLTEIPLPDQLDGPQRLADAVAIAGLSVAEQERRRAVLLILSDEPEDSSSLDAAHVRRFLSRLRVPLVIWTPSPNAARSTGPWGDATDISSLPRLEAAARDLHRVLDHQRIVWIEGLHLPQTVTLSPEASGLSLAQ